ncbi:MAG: Mrp/NBP35 family ATP-binding protein [Planctomycetota bacterium]
MGLTKDDVIGALRSIRESTSQRDLVEAGGVHKVAVCDNIVSVTLISEEQPQVREHLKAAVETTVRRLGAERSEKVQGVTVQFVEPGAAPMVGQDRRIPLKQASSSKTTEQGEARAGESSMPNVKHVIAVGAGKGGVGKSTVSVNLAVGLAKQGHAVGLLDGDIYGPSVPTLLGLDGIDVTLHQNMLQVFNVHGIKAMTIGKLVDPEKPLIWRGPMAHGAFKQLCEQTQWGELDYLIVDLPPGTGDVPLTMAQMLSVTGAIIVCTPQKVAQDDAVRAARMFQQLNIGVLGVVENMSYFIGDDGKEYDIFGRGGAEMMAQRLGLPFLGTVPINMKLREHSDGGDPTKNFSDAGDAMRTALETLVRRTEDEVALASLRGGQGSTVLSVS